MSLREIRRETAGRKGILERLGLKRKSHFRSLRYKSSMERAHDKPPHDRPNYSPSDTSSEKSRIAPPHLSSKTKKILLIAIIAVVVIGAELLLWSGKSAPPVVQDTNDAPINQTNATNSSNTTTPAQPKPDLTAPVLSLSDDTISSGESIMITAKVRNAGEVDAMNFTAKIYIDSKAIFEQTIESLAPGEEVELLTNWTAAEDTGNLQVKVSADPDDEVAEEKENNNERTQKIEVDEKLIEDVSTEFKHQSTANFNILWFSDNFRVPPTSGSGYTYFQLSRESSNIYYLDIAIAGFKATNTNNIYEIAVPDSSASGWNARRCIKRDESSETCVWNGPQITLDMDFSGNKLVATDQNGQDDSVSSSDNKIEDIKLVGMKMASWPGELKTYRPFGAPSPDYFVPTEFYEVVKDKIYIHPLKWNPAAHEAEVTTWMRFKITTD
jgi:hypothetical protein